MADDYTTDEAFEADDFETDPADILGDTVIELTDEDGNLQEFQVLDVIERDGETFYVLIDADDEAEDISEVFCLRLVEDEGEGDEYLSTFEAVEDEDEAHALFELFQERNRDFYDFVDTRTDD